MISANFLVHIFTTSSKIKVVPYIDMSKQNRNPKSYMYTSSAIITSNLILSVIWSQCNTLHNWLRAIANGIIFHSIHSTKKCKWKQGKPYFSPNVETHDFWKPTQGSYTRSRVKTDKKKVPYIDMSKHIRNQKPYMLWWNISEYTVSCCC